MYKLSSKLNKKGLYKQVGRVKLLLQLRNDAMTCSKLDFRRAELTQESCRVKLVGVTIKLQAERRASENVNCEKICLSRFVSITSRSILSLSLLCAFFLTES